MRQLAFAATLAAGLTLVAFAVSVWIFGSRLFEPPVPESPSDAAGRLSALIERVPKPPPGTAGIVSVRRSLARAPAR